MRQHAPTQSGPLPLTLIFSLAEVSKKCRPNWSASCLPRSAETTRSSSISHLLPTRITLTKQNTRHKYVINHEIKKDIQLIHKSCNHFSMQSFLHKQCKHFFPARKRWTTRFRKRRRHTRVPNSFAPSGPHSTHLRVIPGIRFNLRAPILHGAETFLVRDVVHEDEAHGPSIIGGSDCPVSLLTSRVPYLEEGRQWR